MNLFRIFFLVTALFVVPRSMADDVATVAPAVGAWRIAGEPERVLIITPAYWTQSIYDRAQRQFTQTVGGTYAARDGLVEGRIEFDSKEAQQVGERFTLRMRVEGTALTLLHEDGTEEVWTRIDAAESPLAGVWRITGRHANGTFSGMPLRPRRTLKILSGTRFQWVAMNIETGEFSGTGGGTYTFENGKYTEHIEFFSRDGSRVGASLQFDGEVQGDTWRHRGLSSRGEPIDEVWTRSKP